MISTVEKKPSLPLGNIMQLGSVVEDIRQAMDCWLEKTGAGPFFVLDNIAFDDWCWQGKPQHLPMDIAFAQMGGLMIELIRPHGHVPSVYAHCQGSSPQLHHYGFLVDCLEDAEKQLSVGEAVVRARASSGTPFGYYDTRPQLGLMSELIEKSDEIEGLFGLCREAAIGWDGSEPVRLISLGES